ncbi:MAG: XdhC family protein [Chloroflexi bacterium]|nr:XdhC family protein [Chloroflexota bacterium]MCH8350244.1 XdhC family protein [Chloroflexota bacterium]MCI0781480.1 XdhC family protein [Chloroflexota bacterium]MCI0784910.1 XdhC family protein [Chloroflexota bacterium]MCI0824868.1 XdhC family protein [Chloroflexota bacterium]
MKEVIQEAIKLLQSGKSGVLATVVRTKGSTPQKSGAMLLVREDGSGVGTLGGGCVEGDIWFAAKEILRRGGGPEFKDYFLNEDIAARDGLVCGGTMYFYLEPVRKEEDFVPIGDELINAYEGGDPVGLATIVNVAKGGTNLGAKLLLKQDGTIIGTLGDPALDARAKELAAQVADVGNIESFITDDGTEVFVEGFTTPPTLIMVGGGHVGKATADLAHNLGYRVYVVDDRPEFANPERFPYAEQTVVSSYENWPEHLDINVNTFIVAATRGHRYDDLALESALTTRARYIGLLGSRRKTIMIYRRLIGQGISVDRLKQVYAPIGLNIGGLTPEELAVSIMSEIIMVRRGGTGSTMRMDDRYIDRAASIADQAVQV